MGPCIGWDPQILPQYEQANKQKDCIVQTSATKHMVE